MAEDVDKLGVVRQHRWVSADDQAKMLVDRCRIVVSLGGGKLRQVDLHGLAMLARPGTVIEMQHAFLLVDPHRKRVGGGMRQDFRGALARLEKRGAVVVDLDGQVCSRKQRRAFLALVDSDIARHGRGARSATNGARSRGRQAAEFTAEEMRDAKAAWRNAKDYPTWAQASKAMPKGFTPHRAFKLWGGRH